MGENQAAWEGDVKAKINKVCQVMAELYHFPPSHFLIDFPAESGAGPTGGVTSVCAEGPLGPIADAPSSGTFS